MRIDRTAFLIGNALVGRIQQTVNAYYSQFEEPGAEAASTAEPALVDSEPGLEETEVIEVIPEDVAEAGVAGGLATDVGIEEPKSVPAVRIKDPEPPEDSSDSGEQTETKEFGQFDRIEDAGSPTHDQLEGSGPEDTPKEDQRD